MIKIYYFIIYKIIEFKLLKERKRKKEGKIKIKNMIKIYQKFEMDEQQILINFT